MTQQTQLPRRRDVRSPAGPGRPLVRRLAVAAVGVLVITGTAATITYLGRPDGGPAAQTVLDPTPGTSAAGPATGAAAAAGPATAAAASGVATPPATNPAGSGAATAPLAAGAVTQPGGQPPGSRQPGVQQPGVQQPGVQQPAAGPATTAVGSGLPASSGGLPAPSTSAPGRRGYLYLVGHSPSDAEVDAMPARYGVVVLNQWDAAAARRLKQRDPSVVVLMYQCLSSTRSSDDPTHRSGGVLHSAAAPSWFATDTGGNRIGWTPYPGHWQMAVWDAAYQQAWVNDAVADVVAGGWDGVLADNDISTLSWYSDAVVAGTGSRAATDSRLRDGLQQLVDRAGAALNARGKLLVPNISDGRLFPGRWAAHSRYGGGMEENFAHFGQSTTADWVGDWGSDGWIAQTDEMRAPGLSLAITRAAPGDHRTALYGYASMLVRADADAFWMPSTDSGAAYAGEPAIPEMSWPLGGATANPARTAAGAWTRQYAHAWVAVNPTGTAVTLTPPPGTRAADGSAPATVRLDAYSGLILTMA